MKIKTSDLFEEPKRTRINQAGCVLSSGDIDLILMDNVEECVDFILGLVRYKTYPNQEQFEKFLDGIENFIEQAPFFPDCKHIDTSSIKIMSRLIEAGRRSFDFIPNYNTRHKWSQSEKNLIQTLLLEGISQDQIVTGFPHVEPLAVINYINKTKRSLYNRPLNQKEVIFIENGLRKGMSFDDLAKVMHCRSGKQLEKLYK